MYTLCFQIFTQCCGAAEVRVCEFAACTALSMSARPSTPKPLPLSELFRQFEWGNFARRTDSETLKEEEEEEGRKAVLVKCERPSDPAPFSSSSPSLPLLIPGPVSNCHGHAELQISLTDRRGENTALSLGEIHKVRTHRKGVMEKRTQ